MQRDLERIEDLRQASPERAPFGRTLTRSRDDAAPRGREYDLRIEVRDRDRTSRLRPSEAVLVRHVGVFRSIDLLDLERFAYSGDGPTCRDDVRLMQSRGLVAEVTQIDPRSGHTDRIVTLTRAGAAAARAQIANPRQAVYSDFGRPQQLRHDTAVYRMYHAEAARIERGGGRVVRVILEHELTGDYLRARAARSTARPGGDGPGLVAVSGVVQIPDLRIEYERSMGDLARVDLELATVHYGGRQLAAKARAGFTIYADGADAGRVRAAVATHDRFVEVLSL